MPGPCQSRRMRWAVYVACMGESRDVYRVLVGKPEGKIPMDWTSWCGIGTGGRHV